MGIGIRPVADDAVGVVGPFSSTSTQTLKNVYLFDIGSMHFSTVAGTYVYDEGPPELSYDYTAKIISDTFSGITMRLDVESRLMAPSEVTFEIENADGAIAIDSLKDQDCKVTLVFDDPVSGILTRAWLFHIPAEGAVFKHYGKITVRAESKIDQYFKGVWPNTLLAQTEFPSELVVADEMACIPIVFGNAYYSVPPVVYENDGNEEVLFVVGKSTTTEFTFFDAHGYFFEAPKEFGGSKFHADEYTLTLIDSVIGESGVECTLVQPIVFDLDEDGTAETLGDWAYNGQRLSCRVNIQNQTANNTDPGGFLYYLLQDFGIPSAMLDENDFSDIDAELADIAGWFSSITVEVAFTHKEPRESILSDFLSNYDCFLTFDEIIRVRMFEKASTDTFDSSKILAGTYQPAEYDSDKYDGGTVKYIKEGEPFDLPSGLFAVPLWTWQSGINELSDEVFNFRSFVYDDNDFPARFGQLYFQKKFGIDYRVSFAVSMADLNDLTGILPGIVVSIDDEAYGEDKDVLITELKFGADLSLTISGNVYKDDLEEAADVTPVAYTDLSQTADTSVSNYTVRQTAGATSYIELIEDRIKFTSGRLHAPEHDCFQVTMSGNQSNIAEGEDVYVVFDTVTNETPADVFTVDDETPAYYYTANGDGWRQFNINIRLRQVDVGTTEISVKLITSNETFYFTEDGRNVAVDAYPSVAFSQLAWMDDGDTAKIKINITGGAEQVDIQSVSQFSGFYVNTKV